MRRSAGSAGAAGSTTTPGAGSAASSWAVVALDWSGEVISTGAAIVGARCSPIIGTTCSATAGTTTVAATVATMPVVAAAAATLTTLAVVAAAAFMATTRPSVRTGPNWGTRARARPSAARCIVVTITGSSTSSCGSAGPRARWTSERRSRYHEGASGSAVVPSHTPSATSVSNWVMSTHISSRGVMPPPRRRSGRPAAAAPGGTAPAPRPPGAP